MAEGTMKHEDDVGGRPERKTRVVTNFWNIAAVMVAALGYSASAFAQSQWYVAGSAGALLQEDESFSTVIHNGLGMMAPGSNTDTFSPGTELSASVGYRLPQSFRIEGEFDFSENSVATISPNAFGALPLVANGSRQDVYAGGQHHQYAETINLFYDLPVGGRFVPYLGGGVGYYHGDASTTFSTTPTGGPFTGHGYESNNALILAEGGVSVAVDDHWAVVPAYRFEHLFYDGRSAVDDHIFKVGLRFSL
jgi:opacity protein-like surface antigen